MFINSILGLIIVLLIIFILTFSRENFTQGYGNVFGVSPLPPNCNPNNSCFPGHTTRDTLYSNMCEPVNFDSCGRKLKPGQGLLKDRVNLKGNCYRGF